MNDRILKIDIAAIKNNIKGIKKLTEKKFLAVVKCDGYGMGAVSLSRHIEKDADYFGVATIEEGIELREGNIKKSILVLGQILPQDIKYFDKYNLTLTIGDMEFLKYLSKKPLKNKITAHIKFDTGMGRLGINPENTGEVINLIGKLKNIKIEGIYSHLATSEDPDKSYALAQINVFKDILRKFPDGEYLTHIANSGAVIDIPESYKDFSMVRVGLLLFGVYPTLFLKTFKNKPFIKSSLKGKTKVLLVKKVPAFTSLGYGRTYICKQDTTIALIGIGYGDGLNRILSNKIFLKINNHLLPSRGCLSMDQMIVEIPEGLNIKQGDECIFLDEELNIEGMAETCGSVPHEIMCNFGRSRIKKIYTK